MLKKEDIGENIMSVGKSEGKRIRVFPDFAKKRGRNAAVEKDEKQKKPIATQERRGSTRWKKEISHRIFGKVIKKQ